MELHTHLPSLSVRLQSAECVLVCAAEKQTSALVLTSGGGWFFAQLSTVEHSEWKRVFWHKQLFSLTNPEGIIAHATWLAMQQAKARMSRLWADLRMARVQEVLMPLRRVTQLFHAA